MISAIFNLIGACGHFVWELLCALLHLGGSLLSAVFTVLAWPFKATCSLLSGAASWVSLFLGACGVLAVLLLALALLAAFARHRNRG